MRWESLFGDLEAQADALAAGQFRDEAGERARSEHATLELSARLAASRQRTVMVALCDGTRVRGTVADSGADWLLIDDAGRQRLLRLGAVAGVTGLVRRAAVLSAVESRLTMATALRALERDRTPVRVRAGVELNGVIVGVGADHLDVATHAPSEVWAVPMTSLIEVASP